MIARARLETDHIDRESPRDESCVSRDRATRQRYLCRAISSRLNCQCVQVAVRFFDPCNASRLPEPECPTQTRIDCCRSRSGTYCSPPPAERGGGDNADRAGSQVKPNLGSCTMGGFAYVVVGSWSPSSPVSDIDAVVDGFRNAPGMVIDVRPNSGGTTRLPSRSPAAFRLETPPQDTCGTAVGHATTTSATSSRAR